MKKNIAPFIRPRTLKQLLMRVILTMYLNQSIVRLYQTYINGLKKIWVRLLIKLDITLLIFRSINPKVVAVISNYQKN